ncbi:MAG: LamG domain-containing protein, partial [Candidatus Omnitrophota bacterium]
NNGTVYNGAAFIAPVAGIPKVEYGGTYNPVTGVWTADGSEKHYDADGELIKVVDIDGTIKYSKNADGSWTYYEYAEDGSWIEYSGDYDADNDVFTKDCSEEYYDAETDTFTPYTVSEGLEKYDISYTENEDGTWTKETKIIEGVKFDGVDDYIDLPPFNSDAFSTSLWFNNEGSSTSAELMSFGMDENNGFGISLDSENHLALSINGSLESTSISFSENAWNFITVNYDGKNLNIYLDGVLADSFSAASSSVSEYVGRLSSAASPYSGLMGSVLAYNRVLSAEEILSNYNGNVSLQGLVLAQDYLTDIAMDISGNNDISVNDPTCYIKQITTETGVYNTEAEEWYGNRDVRYFDADKTNEYIDEDGEWIKRTVDDDGGE